MESNTKQLMAVFSLMLGLSFGIPYLVSEDNNTSWLMIAVFFLVIALLFWLWVMREQRSAEDAAQESLDAAEENLKKLEAKAADASETASAESVPVVDAEADSDDTSSATDDDSEAEEPLEERSEDSDLEETVEDAESGNPVAKAELADAQAAPSEPATSIEVEVEEDDEVTSGDLLQEETDEILNDADNTASELASAAKNSDGGDDLTVVEGIGPHYSSILVGAGIDTFAKLGALSEDEIVQTVRDNGGRKAGSMGTWAEQAQLAADGKWDALAQLQDDLKGGRR